MTNKQIKNLVFYTFESETGPRTQACVFYEDGTVENTNYEIGKEYAVALYNQQIAEIENSNKINDKQYVYKVTGEEFEKKFQDFRTKDHPYEIVKEEKKVALVPKEETAMVPVQKKKANQSKTSIKEDAKEETVSKPKEIEKLSTEAIEEKENEKSSSSLENEEADLTGIDESDISVTTPEKDDNGIEELTPELLPKASSEEESTSKGNETDTEPLKEVAKKSFKDKVKNLLLTITGVKAANKIREKIKEQRSKIIEKKEKNKAAKKTEPKEKSTSAFMDFLMTITGVKAANKIKEKSKEAKKKLQEKRNEARAASKDKTKKKGLFKRLGQRVTSFATALALLILPGCTSEKSNKSSEKPSVKLEEIKAMNTDDLIQDSITFTKLINASQSTIQQEFMNGVSKTLDDYNITFANAYIEPGKNIRAALSWNEVVAMATVYNNYSKKQLQEIFNGAELDTVKLQDAYKTASLQLMGAYVIETRTQPVDMSNLLNSKAAKDFYQKYHELFLQCKETTGIVQINKVNEFYRELYKDFPITSEVREEGISHADSRDSIEPYKFAIIPMVSASEILFQNLEIDQTLADQAIDYLNDIGICNRANDIIEKAALVSLTTESNTDYANYNTLRTAKELELKDKGAYIIDDEHRDISYLDRFKKQVNVAFDYNGNRFNGMLKYKDNSSYQYEEGNKTTTSDRQEAVSASSEEQVKEAEEKATEEINKENEEARKEAEKKLEEELRRQQELEDEKRKQQENEVAKDDKDLQDKIDEANDKIDNGDKVNEDDFGDHDVDFDDDHSNENGDLDDSVKDITTDPSGDQTGEPLPDPNEEDNSSSSTDQTIIEEEEPYIPTSNEALADAIIEQMAQEQKKENVKEYVYHL